MAELARRMGTTQSATARLEAGRVAPRRSLRDRLADQTSPVVS
jgi:predicted transcriptional regulator